MSFFSVLLTFFIGPLKLLFEVIFHFAYGVLHNPGLSIISLSLAMNVLVLPLYRRADAMQEKARDIEAQLHDGVAHIKKTFTGNERMMMLQTYYRQNNYSPTNALQGSVSLLLEIPFFMAAYQFLSHLELLQGVSFGPIANLGAPDRLLVVAGVTINVLPILMTLINIVSSAIYLKGFPLKSKIQLYAMAAFFLVFLYRSPAGLVFYWTLNNIFSLCKNIFYKIKNPRLVISVITAVLGAAVLVFYFGADAFGYPGFRRIFVLILGIVLFIPAVSYFLRSRPHRSTAVKESSPNSGIFLGAAAFLTVLTGLLIPSTYISASPDEFIDLTHFFHPGWFIVSAASLAAGTFLLWFGVFYWLASPRGKVIFERIMWAACFVAVADYIFFGRNLGNLSQTLQFDNGLTFSGNEILLNLLVVVVLIAVLTFVLLKWSKKATVVLVALTAAMAVLSTVNIVKTVRYIGGINREGYADMPVLTLSRTGQNVVVLFLDRALGEDLPFLVNERPDLKETYDGFTYYSNVISYGGHTNFGAPPILGGYEYTPVEMNRRDSELMVDKHNEALKVLPVLFMENGFDVTVCDPPYANYKWSTDLSIYDDYPEIHKYAMKGYFGSVQAKEQTIENNKRNFFCFSVMKSLPVAIQYAVYDSGNYHRAGSTDKEEAAQIIKGASVADGINPNFAESFAVLQNLREMTQITGDPKDVSLFFYNDAPHEAALLKEPEYEIAAHIDNTRFDKEHQDRFTADGKTITVRNSSQLRHYQTNMATMLQVGEWLKYLKEEGVYDNTKIIIVADHGYYLYQTEEFLFPELKLEKKHYVDIGNYFPLLMVKDFNAHGFTTSDEFMTNADVPAIACDGLIENPVNPFTGKAINSDEKTAHDQFIISNHGDFNPRLNNDTSFAPSTWAVVTKDIRDRDDWEFIMDPVVLKEHQMP